MGLEKLKAHHNYSASAENILVRILFAGLTRKEQSHMDTWQRILVVAT